MCVRVCVCVCVCVCVFIYRVVGVITIDNVCEILLIKPKNTISVQTDLHHKVTLPYTSM